MPPRTAFQSSVPTAGIPEAERTAVRLTCQWFKRQRIHWRQEICLACKKSLKRIKAPLIMHPLKTNMPERARSNKCPLWFFSPYCLKDAFQLDLPECLCEQRRILWLVLWVKGVPHPSQTACLSPPVPRKDRSRLCHCGEGGVQSHSEPAQHRGAGGEDLKHW